MNRVLVASDLKTSDLTAGLDIDFGSKFVATFGKNASLNRVKSGSAEPASGSASGGDNGGGSNGGGSEEIG